MSHPLNSRVKRLTFASLFYVGILGFLGTWLYGKYIYDVGAPYIAMGMFGLPLAVLILWFADRLLSKKSSLQDKYGLLTLIHCVFCVPIYYIMITLAGLIIMMLYA